MFAGADLLVQSDLSGPSLQRRRSLIFLIRRGCSPGLVLVNRLLQHLLLLQSHTHTQAVGLFYLFSSYFTSQLQEADTQEDSLGDSCPPTTTHPMAHAFVTLQRPSTQNTPAGERRRSHAHGLHRQPPRFSFVVFCSSF